MRTSRLWIARQLEPARSEDAALPAPDRRDRVVGERAAERALSQGEGRGSGCRQSPRDARRASARESPSSKKPGWSSLGRPEPKQARWPGSSRSPSSFKRTRRPRSGRSSALTPRHSCVFFPTVVTTHLGFLVQGPYRTTPSRDNVPPRRPLERQQLVQETAALLLDALGALESRIFSMSRRCSACQSSGRSTQKAACSHRSSMRCEPRWHRSRCCHAPAAGGPRPRTPDSHEHKSCANSLTRSSWRRCSMRLEKCTG